jgi:predicted lipid-binding transport protein (Tim44 family)
MMPNILVIRHVSDLDRLLAGGPRITELQVRVSHLAKTERRNLQRQLFAQYNACGCTEASIGTLLGITLVGLFYFGTQNIGLGGYKLWAFYLTIVVIGSLIGKFLGKWRAYKILSTTVSKTKELLA